MPQRENANGDGPGRILSKLRQIGLLPLILLRFSFMWRFRVVGQIERTIPQGLKSAFILQLCTARDPTQRVPRYPGRALIQSRRISATCEAHTLQTDPLPDSGLTPGAAFLQTWPRISQLR